MTGRRLLVAVVILAVIGGAGVAGWRWIGGGTAVLAESGAPPVPTARVSRGSIALTVRMQGDLRAASQVGLSAPSVGGTLRILDMVDTGAQVVEGDTIMEFDPADQIYALEQAESQLQEAQQEINKRKAEIAAQDASEKVTLMTAEFDVRRAELEAQVGPELIGTNEYRIRQVSLEEARKRLDQVRQDAASRAVTTAASLKVLQERLTRENLAAERARQNMDNLVIKAPMAGVVAVRDNRDATNFFFSGMTLPAYRIGDSVNSGRPVVDVFDMAKMEVRARVNEQERANVAPDQPATIASAAVPGVTWAATVSAVSGLGRPDTSAGPLRQFDVTLEISEPDARLKPGTAVDVVVAGPTVDDVLLLPRQALFEKDGKPAVYVHAADGSFDLVPVKVTHRSESQVALEGLDEGTEVALVSPDSVLVRPAAAAPPAPGAPGRRP
ncbi:MAG: efflux RND transporter periplasmic adaptor subunit [Vicinamibacterales bacterium]